MRHDATEVVVATRSKCRRLRNLRVVIQSLLKLAYAAISAGRTPDAAPPPRRRSDAGSPGGPPRARSRGNRPCRAPTRQENRHSQEPTGYLRMRYRSRRRRCRRCTGRCRTAPAPDRLQGPVAARRSSDTRSESTSPAPVDVPAAPAALDRNIMCAGAQIQLGTLTVMQG